MDPTRRKGMHVKVKVFGPLLCLIQAYGRNVQIQVHCIRNLCKKLVIPCEGLKLMNPQSCWKTSMRFGTITPPPETYESNFNQYNFVQFGKQHSR